MQLEPNEQSHPMITDLECILCPKCDHYVRLPGLFRRWELADVAEGSDELHIRAAGATADGTELYAVYCRERLAGKEVRR